MLTPQRNWQPKQQHQPTTCTLSEEAAAVLQEHSDRWGCSLEEAVLIPTSRGPACMVDPMAKRSPPKEEKPYKTQVTFRSEELIHAIDQLVAEGQREGRWPMSYSRSDWINDALLGKHKLPADILAKLKG